MTVEDSAGRSACLVIIPAWNEDSVLRATLTEIATCPLAVDVVVIDDGATDRTATVAAECGATVLRLPFNLGVGGAMRAGHPYASRYGSAQAIQVDADGQHEKTGKWSTNSDTPRTQSVTGEDDIERGLSGEDGFLTFLIVS